jgi:hypothetical protein
MELRTVAERMADVVAALQGQGQMWLATADDAGRPHLIAVSAWWDGSASNMARGRRVKLASGSPDDAILIDAEVVESTAAADAPAALTSGFSAALGWDPREVGDDWAFYRLRPSRIQAYRGYEELEGRDVMRRSRWLA